MANCSLTRIRSLRYSSHSILRNYRPISTRDFGLKVKNKSSYYIVHKNTTQISGAVEQRRRLHKIYNTQTKIQEGTRRKKGQSLLHPTHLPRLNIINPPTNIHRPSNRPARSQKRHIILNPLPELRKRQPIKPLTVYGIKFGHSLRTQILCDRGIDPVVREALHATMGMLDDEDFGRLEQLLGDDEGAEGVAGAAAGVADDMGVAGGDAEGGVGVDAAVHAGYCVAVGM